MQSLVKRYSTAILIGGVGLLLGAIGVYVLLVKTPADLASNVARGMSEAFNFTPQVRIEETVVIEQHAPILEVATVARELFVEYNWTHTWLGSTKTITLRGTFTAKAGFDLKKPFTITIEKNPLRVIAELPPATILSLQMNSYKIMQDESGWWNRISDSDRESAVLALQVAARQKAGTSGMLEEARSTAEERIREIVERNGALVSFSSETNPGKE